MVLLSNSHPAHVLKVREQLQALALLQTDLHRRELPLRQESRSLFHHGARALVHDVDEAGDLTTALRRVEVHRHEFTLCNRAKRQLIDYDTR